MDKHYFSVARRGPLYVAAITFEEHKDNVKPKRELVLGTVHASCFAHEGEVKEWANMMSRYSDTAFTNILAKLGITNSVASTETIYSIFPGVQ